MSHLPVEKVDKYLDKLPKRSVILVGVVVIALLILCGPAASDLMRFGRVPKTAAKPGQLSQQYFDSHIRTATTPGDDTNDTISPALWYSSPFGIVPETAPFRTGQ